MTRYHFSQWRDLTFWEQSTEAELHAEALSNWPRHALPLLLAEMNPELPRGKRVVREAAKLIVEICENDPKWRGFVSEFILSEFKAAYRDFSKSGINVFKEDHRNSRVGRRVEFWFDGLRKVQNWRIDHVRSLLDEDNKMLVATGLRFLVEADDQISLVRVVRLSERGDFRELIFPKIPGETKRQGRMSGSLAQECAEALEKLTHKPFANYEDFEAWWLPNKDEYVRLGRTQFWKTYPTGDVRGDLPAKE